MYTGNDNIYGSTYNSNIFFESCFFPGSVNKDSSPGMTLTVSLPVYTNSPYNITGLVSVEGTIATVFSEVVNFHLGYKSYMYLVDVTHGMNMFYHNQHIWKFFLFVFVKKCVYAKLNLNTLHSLCLAAYSHVPTVVYNRTWVSC